MIIGVVEFIGYCFILTFRSSSDCSIIQLMLLILLQPGWIPYCQYHCSQYDVLSHLGVLSDFVILSLGRGSSSLFSCSQCLRAMSGIFYYVFHSCVCLLSILIEQPASLSLC